MAGVKVDEGTGPEIDTTLVSVDAESRHRQRVALGPAGETRFDYGARTDGNPVYIGTHGVEGTLGTATTWLVQKFTYDASSRVERIQTLSGAWDSRTTLGWTV